MPEAVATPDDHRLAAELATEAGQLLVDLRAELAALGGRSGRRSRRRATAGPTSCLMARLADAVPG